VKDFFIMFFYYIYRRFKTPNSSSHTRRHYHSLRACKTDGFSRSKSLKCEICPPWFQVQYCTLFM
jgi:hypothetical protein